jgi:hypothetical protein
MMDFKLLTSQFKDKHKQAGTTLGFSLLPLLMEYFVDNGLNISHAGGKFFQEIAAELFDNRELQLYAIDYMILISNNIPIPAVQEQSVKKVANPALEAVIEDDIVRTDHLTTNIPYEDEDGDPLYTPPEDRINLRPEDCEPMQYDEDFCARIGATKDRR